MLPAATSTEVSTASESFPRAADAQRRRDPVRPGGEDPSTQGGIDNVAELEIPHPHAAKDYNPRGVYRRFIRFLSAFPKDLPRGFSANSET